MTGDDSNVSKSVKTYSSVIAVLKKKYGNPFGVIDRLAIHCILARGVKFGTMTCILEVILSKAVVNKSSLSRYSNMSLLIIS